VAAKLWTFSFNTFFYELKNPRANARGFFITEVLLSSLLLSS